MFDPLQPVEGRFRRHRGSAVSALVHLGLLAGFFFSRPKPITMEPNELAYGSGEHSYRVVYMPPGDEPVTLPDAALNVKARIEGQRPRVTAQKKQQKHEPLPANAEVAAQESRAGSPLGTLIEGPMTGHEVHVAYPIVFPDPPVVRSELPPGLQGDVVVEVTIDAQGNVVETRVVQSIGHGIDEKIVSALRQWHFQPATLDGTPVASKHDVHFHFPS